jgi:SAM-dependent methyltransferase
MDAWAVGDAYEPYVGRWSRLVARKFLSWLAISPAQRWLDVGCGTGALTETIIEANAPARIDAIDPSSEYLAFARSRIPDGRARFIVADAESLPQPDQSTDVIVSGLALNFVPHPDAALAEMKRVARTGGTVAVYVWDYAGKMQLMRYFWDAAVELDQHASQLDEGRRFPMCDPVVLETLFRDAGLRSVESIAIDVPTRFKDFDDYWNPFLGGQGPAPGYAMSLDENGRTALRENIRAALPVAANGSIDLIARAWAVRGVRTE